VEISVGGGNPARGGRDIRRLYTLDRCHDKDASTHSEVQSEIAVTESG
jgi:hypothetical protein